MPFTFKLSQRLARMRGRVCVAMAPALAACLAVSACERFGPAPTGPGPQLAQIVVLPESLTVAPAQLVQFVAYGRTSAGDSTSAPVTWSTSGGSIASNGSYTADTGSGDFMVTAMSTQSGVSGSSRVRVRKVKTVTVSPPTATVALGQTVQLTATLRDASGNVLTGRTVTWSSSNLAVATVSASGLVTAGAVASQATITATSEGQSGTATVTVVSNAPVASVTVTPATASVAVGQTVRLTATLRDANGNVLSGRTVLWTSDNAVAATVDGNGLVSGVSAGPAVITATSEGKSGAATVTVVAPVASVTVTPATASVAVGQTVQLTATLRDANGNVLSGRTVLWTSDNAVVATVDGTGLVSGVSAGPAVITATSEGKSGSASVTVTAPSGAPECATPQPGWIWCDDFEQNRLSQYFEYDSAGGSFVRVTGVGVGGSYGMRVRFALGQVEAGSLHLAMGKVPDPYFRTVDAGTALYRDVYWRMYVRTQPGWVGGSGYKLSRAISFATSTWAEAMMAHLWGDPPATGELLMDPASGTDAAGNLKTTKYNDFANFRWLGALSGVTPLFDASHVGQWYCVEAHAQLNDAGSSNGVFEFWINGNLDARETGLNWVGSYSAYAINALFFENYWNTGSPAAQERYFDNIVISTQRIGC